MSAISSIDYFEENEIEAKNDYAYYLTFEFEK